MIGKTEEENHRRTELQKDKMRKGQNDKITAERYNNRTREQ